MSTGRVLGGALRMLRRGRLVVIGMAVAIMGLVYALLDAVLRSYNQNYLDQFANTLTANVPAYFPLLLLAAVLIAVVGGLLAEGELILSAGSKSAGRLMAARDRVHYSEQHVDTRSVIAKLPQLLAVALLVWWKLLLALLIVFAPIIYWAFVEQSQSDGWVATILGSSCIGGVLFLVGWFWYWPQQRLANCALLLERLPPRQAVRTARMLFRGNLGNSLGFWFVLFLLNVGLVVVSLLLAGLGAGLVAAVWSGLNGMAEQPAFIITAIVAAIAGVVLLVWDGAVSAFNLNAWVLAYLDLRFGGQISPIDPTEYGGSTQFLGRHRDMSLDTID